MAGDVMCVLTCVTGQSCIELHTPSRCVVNKCTMLPRPPWPHQGFLEADMILPRDMFLTAHLHCWHQPATVCVVLELLNQLNQGSRVSRYTVTAERVKSLSNAVQCCNQSQPCAKRLQPSFCVVFLGLHSACSQPQRLMQDKHTKLFKLHYFHILQQTTCHILQQSHVKQLACRETTDLMRVGNLLSRQNMPSSKISSRNVVSWRFVTLI